MSVGYPDDPLPGPRMPRCETCKWWQLKDGYSYDLRPGWGHCERTVLNNGDTLQHSDTLAFAEDAESYRAWLTTAPTFGCVMHDPKDTP
jgi:hypothetical protein